jgi:hypothetical protein
MPRKIETVQSANATSVAARAYQYVLAIRSGTWNSQRARKLDVAFIDAKRQSYDFERIGEMARAAPASTPNC